MPFRCAVAFRFAANFGERRSAGGVGSGSGEFSQIGAALSGPSISGFGAGLVLGSSTLRSCVHCACASLRLPPERRAPRPFELDELLVALEEPCVDEAEPLLTCWNPPSDVPVLESGVSAESAGPDASGAGAAVSASVDGAGVAAESSLVAAAESAVAGSAASDDASSVVVVVASTAAELSSAIEAEKRLPATAANEAPAKNRAVNTKVVASRRLRPFGSPDGASSGSGLPPKSQLSFRVNHRGIAVAPSEIEPLAATRGAEVGLLFPPQPLAVLPLSISGAANLLPQLRELTADRPTGGQRSGAPRAMNGRRVKFELPKGVNETVTVTDLVAYFRARFGAEEGQTMAEYGVVLAVIPALVVGAILALSTGIKGALDTVTGYL